MERYIKLILWGVIKISIIYLSKRKLSLWFLGLVIILAVLIMFPTLLKNTAQEVVSVIVAGGKLHPIYAVEMTEKRVAFSFDAAWGSTRTPILLNILKKYDIKTTFFLTNIWLKQYPDLAKEIAAAGHEIGLHSANHPKFTTLSEEQMKKELIDNKVMVKEITGQDAYLFRPPFGDYNNRVIEAIKKENLIPIQWSIDSLDWKNLSENEIYDRVTKRIKPGAIVLFHNDGANTPKALEPIIKYLLDNGYSVVPISELIYKDNYYVDNNGIQKEELQQNQ